jgi:hypothetical protein
MAAVKNNRRAGSPRQEEVRMEKSDLEKKSRIWSTRSRNW